VTPGRVWVIGCGTMGGAMLRGWIGAGLDPAGVTVIEPYPQNVPDGVDVRDSVPGGGDPPDLVLLAVKPQMLGDVTPALAAQIGPRTLLLSILAGVELASLSARFGSAKAIIRVMPNTPVAIGKGVLALHAQAVDEATRTAVTALMQPLGIVEWIADEGLFDAVTALSGSGPAFLFRFIETLGRAGAALGLPADQAARLALATVEGAALLAAASPGSPGALADKVASKGGSTREGLNVLDADGALQDLLTATLTAATRRNAQMAAEARGR
jgi:pyrroline-5-carboxylate reductase